MKKLPRVFGAPLNIMTFIIVAVVIVSAGRCGRSAPSVILIDSIPADTVRVSLIDTTTTRSTRARKTKAKMKADKTPPRSRDYLNEPVNH